MEEKFYQKRGYMALLSYIRKHIQPTDCKYLLSAVPILLGIFACMICLAGTTWAWFTANSEASVQIIQSAEYSVAVEVEDKSNENRAAIVVEENVASCALAPNTSYSVKLTPNGTATKGFCLITDGTNVYTTGPLSSGGVFEFTYNHGLQGEFSSALEYDELLQEAPSRTLAIAWYWGEYPNTLGQETYSIEEPIRIENGSTIGQPIVERPEEKASLSLQLNNVIADRESGMIDTDADCVITFIAAEGYDLPESIVIDGVENYSYQNGILTIFADQLRDGKAITVTVNGAPKNAEEPTISSAMTKPTIEQTMPIEEDNILNTDSVENDGSENEMANTEQNNPAASVETVD